MHGELCVLRLYVETCKPTKSWIKLALPGIGGSALKRAAEWGIACVNNGKFKGIMITATLGMRRPDHVVIKETFVLGKKYEPS